MNMMKGTFSRDARVAEASGKSARRAVWLRQKFGKAARLAVALLLVVGSAVFSAAQQYEIMRADYGAGSQRRDVTSAFRQAVCSQTRFRMGNSTFGFDPSPGNKKSLRVYVRGPRGQQTMQEFPESSTIDGSQYMCRGGGGGGYRPPPPPLPGPPDRGSWTIMHAAYGTERRNVDVTQRLRDLAGRNLTFRMGNSTFGVDPDPGRIKTLRIYARGMGNQRRMFEYREGSTIDGSQFSGWRNGNWGRDPWNGRWNDSDYR
jgi:hypothetical protein